MPLLPASLQCSCKVACLAASAESMLKGIQETKNSISRRPLSLTGLLPVRDVLCFDTALHSRRPVQSQIIGMFSAPHAVAQAYNEGWGELPEEVANTVQLIQAGAPGKLVTGASGWIWHGLGDFVDVHQYASCLFPVTPKALLIQHCRAPMQLALASAGKLACSVSGGARAKHLLRLLSIANLQSTTKALQTHQADALRTTKRSLSADEMVFQTILAGTTRPTSLPSWQTP